MQKIPIEFRSYYELNSQKLDYVLSGLKTKSVNIADIEIAPDFIQLELIKTFHNELHVNGWFLKICKLEDRMKKGVVEIINFYLSKGWTVEINTLTHFCKIIRLRIFYYFRYAAAAKKDEQNSLILKIIFNPQLDRSSFNRLFRDWYYRPKEENISQFDIWRKSKYLTVWLDTERLKIDSQIYYNDWILPQIVAETIRLVDGNRVAEFLPYVWDFEEVSIEKREI